MRLGAGEVGQALPPAFVWWRDFAARYVGALCLHASGAASEAAVSVLPAVPPPPSGDLATLVLTAPMMPGAEYLTADVLLGAVGGTGRGVRGVPGRGGNRSADVPQGAEPGVEPGRPRAFQSGGKPPRSGAPFAFMATYTTRLSARQGPASTAGPGSARIRRGGQPRQAAVAASAGAARGGTLRLAQGDGRCGRDFPSAAVDAGEAMRLLQRPELESAGVVVRMPATWRANRPPRPQVTAHGRRPPAVALGLDALLDFQMEVTLDGEPLTTRKSPALLAGTDSLVLLRGRWVEIDRNALERAMRQFGERAGWLSGWSDLRRSHASARGRRCHRDTDQATGIADWSQ